MGKEESVNFSFVNDRIMNPVRSDSEIKQLIDKHWANLSPTDREHIVATASCCRPSICHELEERLNN